MLIYFSNTKSNMEKALMIRGLIRTNNGVKTDAKLPRG